MKSIVENHRILLVVKMSQKMSRSVRMIPSRSRHRPNANENTKRKRALAVTVVGNQMTIDTERGQKIAETSLIADRGRGWIRKMATGVIIMTKDIRIEAGVVPEVEVETDAIRSKRKGGTKKREGTTGILIAITGTVMIGMIIKKDEGKKHIIIFWLTFCLLS